MIPSSWISSLFSSPAHVVVTAAFGLALWTCGVRTLGPDSEVPPTSEETEALRFPESEDTPRGYSVRYPDSLPPAERTGAFLRHAPDPSRLGQPIGIENPRAMGPFHRALARAESGQGQARIVFYGASHVASDSFTGLIRQELQRRFGDAGHGFVLPVHPWRSYVHSGIRIESDYGAWEALRPRGGNLDVGYYGLAGVAMETRNRSWGAVSTASRGDLGRTASSFDVFYLKQPGGGAFDVLLDGVVRERVETHGSAMHAGYVTIGTEDGAHRLELRTHGNGPVRIFGVAVERQHPGVVLDTLGINGARVRLHLLWEDGLYREHLARRRADLVVLAYGTNEAGDEGVPLETYEQRLRSVIARIHEVAPQASCLMVGPSDWPVVEDDGSIHDRPRTAAINEIQRRAAYDLGCGYFDLVAFQGGPLSMRDWVTHDPPHGAGDYVHFTRHGYQRLGEELLAAMLDGYVGAY